MKTLHKLLGVTAFCGLALLFATSCGDTTNPGPEEPQLQTKSFSVTAANASLTAFTTRVDNTQWEEGDQIGIVALADGKPIGNVPYKLSDVKNGSFVPVGEPFKGEYKESLELYAYYPYTENPFDFTDDFIIYVRFNEDVDALRGICDNLAPMAAGDLTPHFAFEHRMSRVSVVITEDPQVLMDGYLPSKAEVGLVSDHELSDPISGDKVVGAFNSVSYYSVITDQISVDDGIQMPWTPYKYLVGVQDETTGFWMLPRQSFIVMPGDVLKSVLIKSAQWGEEQIEVFLPEPITLEGGKEYIIEVYAPVPITASQVSSSIVKWTPVKMTVKAY